MFRKGMGEMKKTKLILLVAALTMGQLLTGCGASETSTESDGETVANVSVNDTEANAENAVSEAAENTETAEENSQVASADEMADVADVVEEGMTPVYAAELKDGVYPVIVDSSSSMFSITSCELTVENGTMTAVMTMGGTGYLQVFMGTGEEAVKAEEDTYIPYVENENGEHTFTVPVEALDMGIDCSAFSKRKEKWYDRVLVFRADSLPQEAFVNQTIVTVESLSLEDGTYTVEVQLEGGSGKATVESPATLKVENGKAYATIIWSSSNYDYMVVEEEKYEPINTQGNSTFEIPVAGFDRKLSVSADTTAMSTPHEIEYTLYFDSNSITRVP